MKKVISIMLLIVMILALGISATGCKSTTGDDGAKSDFDGAIPGGTADVSEEVLAALQNSGKISLYIYGDGKSAGNEETVKWREDFNEYYRQVYGGELEYRQIVWEGWENTYITQYASKDNADLIYLFEKNFPKFANRGMVFSVEEMQEMGVVGFDHPVIQKDYDLVSTYFKYKGQQFAFANNMAEADMIFVNESLFKEYNVKSPSEYYNEGIWNWETFEKCASELTRDTDGDGASDVFGYYGWDGNFVINAAGGQLVKLQDDGTLVVGLEDAGTIQGLENYANIFGRLKCAGKIGFGTGKLGMIAWMPQNEDDNLIGANGRTKYTFEWSMVPYPLDERTNVDGIRSGKSYAWCVSSTAENPQGCINYIIASKTYSAEKPKPGQIKYEDVFTAEQIEMINDCTRKAVVPIYQGVGTLWSAQWDFWGMVGKGRAASEVVNSYKSMFEAQVQLENNYATH